MSDEEHIPESDAIKQPAERVVRRMPAEPFTISKLVQKHGGDYVAMRRDVERGFAAAQARLAQEKDQVCALGALGEFIDAMIEREATTKTDEVELCKLG